MYLGMESNKVYGEKNMLVVARKFNESIMINDDVRIKILEIKKRRVRIGISASKTVIVHREEIYKKLLAEQEQ